MRQRWWSQGWGPLSSLSIFGGIVRLTQAFELTTGRRNAHSAAKNWLTVFTRPHLTAFDRLMSARMPAAEWERTLAFRQQAQFAEALPRYAALMLKYFSDNLLLNRVVTEAWRFEMLVYALYLHDTYDPENPGSGLTVSNLQDMCLRQNCASRGRVVAILGIMRVGGFVRQVRSESDRRIKHLVPTRKFLDIVEGWNNRIFQIIDAVHPAERLAEAHLTRPQLGRAMRCRGAESLLAGWKLLDHYPEVNHFVARDGGWMLLLHCVAEALKQRGDFGVGPVAVDLGAFGKKFAVSRSHLRRTLESAHDAGLLEEPPRNGTRIVLSNLTVASFLTCMASELSFYRDHALASGLL